MSLLCALCLHEQREMIQPTRLLARPAITVANGHALCEEHFISIHTLVNPAGGAPALGYLKQARPFTS